MCGGKRLRPEALEIKFNGLDIAQLSRFAIDEVLRWFNSIKLKGEELEIASPLISVIKNKLLALQELNIGYLSIDRKTSTLSGGEAQRLRISTQLISGLSNLTYILDEPTVGMHSSDVHKLRKSLDKLKQSDNTLLVVEHDKEMIQWADHIIDMGPGAGIKGGEIIARGKLSGYSD